MNKLPKYVKRSFGDERGYRERMWIRVIAQVAGGYVGTLSNKPAVLKNVKKGDVVTVLHKEIVDRRFE